MGKLSWNTKSVGKFVPYEARRRGIEKCKLRISSDTF